MFSRIPRVFAIATLILVVLAVLTCGIQMRTANAGGAVIASYWGAAGNGTADDGAHINTAIAAGKNGTIILPYTSTGYLIDTPINLTGQVGAVFEGQTGSMYMGLSNNGGTPTLICNTGSQPCIDTTGSFGLILRNVALVNGSTSPSQIDILQARAPGVGGGSNQRTTFDHVSIQQPTGGTFNGGYGYIGIYNYGSELVDYNDLYIQGDDTPIVITSTNSLGITSPYQTIATGSQSMTEISFTGKSVLVGDKGPEIYFEGAPQNIDLGSLYMYNTCPSCYAADWKINGALWGLTWINGRSESGRTLAELTSGSSLDDSTLRNDFAETTGSAFQMDTGSGTCPVLANDNISLVNGGSGTNSMIKEVGTGCANQELLFDIISTNADSGYGWTYLTVTQGAPDVLLANGFLSSGISLPSGSNYCAMSNSGNLQCTNINGRLTNTCKGSQALNGASPSVVTISNSCITTACIPSAIIVGGTAAPLAFTTVAAGSMSITGPAGSTANVAWTCQ